MKIYYQVLIQVNRADGITGDDAIQFIIKLENRLPKGRLKTSELVSKKEVDFVLEKIIFILSFIYIFSHCEHPIEK